MEEGVDSSVIVRTIPNMTIKLVLDMLDSPNLPYSLYRISDGDRPDIVATKLYGASRYAWVIMLANKMRDDYDWPLSDSEFYEYMNRKYETTEGANNGYQASKNTISKYIWITSDMQQLEVDQTFYNTLTVNERKTLSVYDIEYADNDKRREIRVPALDALSLLVSDLNKALV